MNARQTRKLFAGAGMISMLLGTLMVVAPVGAGATQGDVSGFNGTVSVDGLALDDGPGHTTKPNDPRDDKTDTDPHVDCGLQLEFFNFDSGETADITITAQPPSGKDTVILQRLGEPISNDSSGGAANDPDDTREYSYPADFSNTDGLKVHPVHGIHVKLTVNIFRAGEQQPVGQKHKVFWMEGCEQAESAALNVVKLVDPAPDGDGPEFSFAGPDGQFFLGHDDSVGHVVTPGEHTVTETELRGYELDSVECFTAYDTSEPVPFASTATEAGDGVTVALAAGDVVTCVFTNVPETASTNSVTIVKTNNADGQGEYGKAEQTSPGTTVPFRVVITNTGDEALDVVSLVDTWPTGNSLDLLSAGAGVVCTTPGEGEPVSFDLVDDLLQPSVPVTCDFSIANYIAGSNASLTNTVTLDTDKTEPVSDTSTVTTPGSGGCVANCGGPSPTYSVDVDKVNDADGDGDFSNSETAAVAGADVEFQITIRNTGTGTLVLERLVDEFGDPEENLLDGDLACGSTTLTAGSTIAAGATIVCTFTLDDYAPAAGTSIVNTVTVDTDRADDSDDSRVRTRRVQVLPQPPVENPPVDTPPQVSPNETPRKPTEDVAVKGVQVTRQLPRTGSESTDIAGFGAGMLLLGAGLVMISRSRRFGIEG